MTWHVLGVSMTGAIVHDTPFNSLPAAERYIREQSGEETMLYRTYHEQHHMSCECLDCGTGVCRPQWLDRFEAVLALSVFFLIGYLVGYALA